MSLHDEPLPQVANPLAGAVVQPLRIRYYIDGWNSFLFSEQAAGVGRSLLEEGLSAFPAHYAELFDFEFTPERRARFVANCLYRVQHLIVSRHEDALRAAGKEVIDQQTVRLKLSGFQLPLFFEGQKREPFAAEGKTYFEVSLHGTVFCPELNSEALKRQLKGLLSACKHKTPADRYKYVVQNIENKLRMLDRGRFHESQRYYLALGKEIGEVSRKGYYQASDENAKIVTEKAVDMDMGTKMLFDVYNDQADVFILITNDGDFYPAAEKAREHGKAVFALYPYGTPAKALTQALGDENIIRFYDFEKENYEKFAFDFQFSHFLRNEDQSSLQIIEDMERQYAWWEAHGQVKRPDFPSAFSKKTT